ncbi:hypothetical protein M422DRAFT_56535 [Sphaerobolus stellatus SS14]|uniref:Uncharacterized protein n=1 Tax=Sphaerobolus stellatus (strain SS14) TaxID=990650 RepID=A0A0C9TQ94_SPHS4|nr:hypothetical protein M422DRAFT_56535 [Sphaerobolus stellatus SS14]
MEFWRGQPVDHTFLAETTSRIRLMTQPVQNMLEDIAKQVDMLEKELNRPRSPWALEAGLGDTAVYTFSMISSKSSKVWTITRVLDLLLWVFNENPKPYTRQYSCHPDLGARPSNSTPNSNSQLLDQLLDWNSDRVDVLITQFCRQANMQEDMPDGSQTPGFQWKEGTLKGVLQSVKVSSDSTELSKKAEKQRQTDQINSCLMELSLFSSALKHKKLKNMHHFMSNCYLLVTSGVLFKKVCHLDYSYFMAKYFAEYCRKNQVI